MQLLIQKVVARLSCLTVLTLKVLCLASVLSAPTIAAEPFPDSVSGRLFQVQGSNTVGASLMKNFLTSYLEARGASDVRVEDLPQANEYRVIGSVQGRDVFVDVGAHGSSTGFRALLSGDADLSMSSRPIKSKEVDQMAAYGDMLGFEAEHVIAIDGLAVIVNKDNPLTRLSLDQIAGVFSGQITNWKQLGAEDLAINVYARDENSGTWDTFKSLVLRKIYRLSGSAQRFESNDELSDRVARDPGGIGFVGLASVRNSRALLVFDQGTTPLLPEHVSVATEDYLLSRRLFLYTPPSLKTEVIEDFIRFVQSDAGQFQVEQTGFISQALTAIASDAERNGPKDYLAVTEGASRLSVNFRFAEGSSVLDNKARQDIRRVQAFMARAENQGRVLTLIGFGDEKQSESRSLVLSKLRAVSVKTALHRVGVNTRPVEGFGAFLPVASNDGKEKVKNRRVEIWVR
ncbi:substrate-binding domain-containing protein [Aestuariicella sp. G3-2]|uniref:substrate-binding domain-containing protein n=1 Tax=Pseudomaricurvus albidus TaxID=2842452 RepID=UPI001C0CC031|nr:substrate-binding domain-containing protein [Aestuariicella albida]